MKRYQIVLVIIIVAVVAFPFVRNVVLTIQRFNALADVKQAEVPYNLPDKFLLLQNVRTKGTDTMRFDNVKLVNFWASWCIPCIREQPSLEMLRKERPRLDIVQLSFDSLHLQQNTIKKHGWTVPAYYLSDTSFFKMPVMLPTTLVIDDSKVIMESIGVQNWQDEKFLKFIDSLLARRSSN